MSVYFHANFKLDRSRLADILKLIRDDKKISDENIAKKFGYKAPFTKRYISWLKKCGIIENSNKRILTKYGKVIYKNDPNLQKQPSIWFMHTELTKSEENAEAWCFFYNKYLSLTKTFKKDQLQLAISMKMMPHDPSHFGKNAPMIEVITKVLINSYISESAFGPLNIVESNNGTFHRGEIKAPYDWNNLEAFSCINYKYYVLYDIYHRTNIAYFLNLNN